MPGCSAYFPFVATSLALAHRIGATDHEIRALRPEGDLIHRRYLNEHHGLIQAYRAMLLDGLSPQPRAAFERLYGKPLPEIDTQP